MRQESQNKLTKNISGIQSLHIQISPDSSTMLVEVVPDFGFNYIALIGLVFLTIFFFVIEDGVALVTLLLGELVFGGMLLYSVFIKRTLRCSIDKTTDAIHCFRGGMFNTKFDESESNYKISEVTSLVMKRHFRRYGDTFQVLLSIKRWEKTELTGRDLIFSECQSYAEKIRNFIDPALPIKAVD